MINFRHRTFYHTLIGILTIWTTPVQASPLVLDKSETVEITPLMRSFVDTSGKVGADDVRLRAETVPWQPASGETRSHGIRQATLWYELTLTNETADSEWYLVNRWPHAYQFNVFFVPEDGVQPIQKIQLSNRRPFDDRPIDHRFLVAPMNFPKGATGRLIVQAESANVAQAPMDLIPATKFFESDSNRLLWDGIFFGIIFVMIFYNLSVYLAFRDSNYVLYVVFIALFGILQSHFLGYSFQYLWPDLPWLQERAIGVFIGFTIFAGGYFVDRYLELQLEHPKFSKPIRALAWAAFGCGVLSFVLPPTVATAMGATVAIPICTMAFLAGVQSWRGGYTPAAYFTLAWGIFLLGVVLFALQKFGIFAYGPVTENLISIGHAVEVTLLSFGLAERINATRREAFEAQQRALDNEIELSNFQKEALDTEKQIRQALEEALQKAEQANRLKSEFLANMSHELRTPLNAIINVPTLILNNYTATRFWHCDQCGGDFEDPTLSPIREPESSEKCPDCDISLTTDLLIQNGGDMRNHFRLLNRCKTSGNYLLKIINDLLDISKLEAEQMKISPETFELLPVFEEIQATLTDLATTKGIELKFELETNAMTAYADTVKTQQTLVNLVGNAIKFTQEGSVTFKAATDVDGTLLFSVRDTGCGIPEHSKNLVFESFRQVDGGHTRKHGGTGLGLAISKRLVELHGGSIWLESEMDVGTTFFFTLPKNEASFERMAVPLDSGNPGIVERPNIPAVVTSP